MKQKKIKIVFIALLVAVIFGFNSLNSTNEIVIGNIESLTSGDYEDYKTAEHNAYSRLLCGNDLQSWTYFRIDGKPTGFCEWNNEIHEKIGTCIEIIGSK